jgi:hypothetical protein
LKFVFRFGKHFRNITLSSVSSGQNQASASAKPRLLFSSSITSKLSGSDYIGGTCSAVSTCDQRIGSSSAFQQHAPRRQLGDIIRSTPRPQLGISAAASLAQPQASALALQQQEGDSSGVFAAALWCSFSSSSR